MAAWSMNCRAWSRAPARYAALAATAARWACSRCAETRAPLGADVSRVWSVCGPVRGASGWRWPLAPSASCPAAAPPCFASSRAMRSRASSISRTRVRAAASSPACGKGWPMLPRAWVIWRRAWSVSASALALRVSSSARRCSSRVSSPAGSAPGRPDAGRSIVVPGAPSRLRVTLVVPSDRYTSALTVNPPSWPTLKARRSCPATWDASRSRMCLTCCPASARLV